MKFRGPQALKDNERTKETYLETNPVFSMR